MTRPGITYAVQQLSQFVGSPTHQHWEAAIHLLRYLIGCPSKGLFFPTKSFYQLTAYSDVDWFAFSDSRKSLTGYCVLLSSSLISSKTKKQTAISRSSVEAEYRSMGSTICELQWILYILKDFQISPPLPILLLCDNKAAIHITANPVFHERTKHLKIDCHVVQHQYTARFISFFLFFFFLLLPQLHLYINYSSEFIIFSCFT